MYFIEGNNLKGVIQELTSEQKDLSAAFSMQKLAAILDTQSKRKTKMRVGPYLTVEPGAQEPEEAWIRGFLEKRFRKQLLVTCIVSIVWTPNRAMTGS